MIVSVPNPPETIFPSCEAANDALGPCLRPLANSDGGHWWYIDHAEESNESSAFILCVCKSCPQRMRLSADAEEYPL